MNWEILQELREHFLNDAIPSDYWKSETYLEHYDQTFGRRILWKWQNVLSELEKLKWTPPDLPLYDWGCGTGVASEAFQNWNPRSGVYLHDRSKLSIAYAAKKVKYVLATPPEKFILLVSHVINELDRKALPQLLEVCEKAECILWVEAGTREHAEKLVEVRDKLVAHFYPIAPCPDTLPCGMRSTANTKHWCHHFGNVPSEIHQSSEWKRFSKELGIDLRSLPLSYLVLDKNSKREMGGTARVIGQTRTHGGFVECTVCEKSTIESKKYTKGKDKALFQSLKKETFGPLI